MPILLSLSSSRSGYSVRQEFFFLHDIPPTLHELSYRVTVVYECQLLLTKLAEYHNPRLDIPTMAEAISVVGLVGSIITIIETITETYKRVKDAGKLPDAFTVVKERIPIMHETLTLIDESYRDSEDEPAIRQTLSTCKSNAEDLSYIFSKVCTDEGDTVIQRYGKALRSLKLGRGDKVETLFKKILDSLLALQVFHVFKNAIPVEKLRVALEELDDIDSSIADGNNTTIHSSGAGAVFNSGYGELRLRQQIGNGGYQAETMNFNTPGKTLALSCIECLLTLAHDIT